MRIGQVVGLVIIAGNLSGCLFGSLDADIRKTRLQVEGLNQRVTSLEASHRGGTEAAMSADASLAFAEGPGTDRGTQWPVFVWGKAFGKLARGAANTVTGWVEIPKRVYETSVSSGPFAGWTWGLLRGLGHGFVRTIGGVYEVVTFPFRAPRDYRPVIRPEYVFTCES